MTPVSARRIARPITDFTGSFAGRFRHHLACPRPAHRGGFACGRRIGCGFYRHFRPAGGRGAFPLQGQPASGVVTPGSKRRRCRWRDGRRQGLQQGFTFIQALSGIGRRIRAPLAAIPLPIPTTTVVARPVIARAFVPRPVVPWTIFALPVLAGTVFAGTLVTGTVVSGTVAGALLVTRAVIPATVVVAGALFAHRRALVIAVAVTAILIGVVVVAVSHFVIITIAATAAIGAAIRRPLAIIAEHPEIMFRIVQIIFGGDPVASLLGVAGKGAIFFQQLGGIATLAVVQAVAIVVAAGHLLRARAAAAATAPPPLVVPDQIRRSRTWPSLAAVG